MSYRKSHKSKSLTETAAKKLAASLQEIFNAGHDTDDALGMAEEHGWATIKLGWYENAGGKSHGNGKGRKPQYGDIRYFDGIRKVYHPYSGWVREYGVDDESVGGKPHSNDTGETAEQQIARLAGLNESNGLCSQLAGPSGKHARFANIIEAAAQGTTSRDWG